MLSNFQTNLNTNSSQYYQIKNSTAKKKSLSVTDFKSIALMEQSILNNYSY